MEILNKEINIPMYWVALTLSFIISMIFGYFFLISDPATQPKVSTLLAGFASAFLVAFFQLLVSVYEAIKLRRYEKIGVLEIRQDRKSQSYYSKLIKQARSEILVLGVTASRFMDDFASDQNTKCQALIEALTKNVKVRILLPKYIHLSPTQQSDLRGKTMESYRRLLEKNFDIQIRFFDHIPTQSLVATDTTCIVGPVFPDIDSKNTPSIVMKKKAALAQGYLQHFDKEWNEANESPE